MYILLTPLIYIYPNTFLIYIYIFNVEYTILYLFFSNNFFTLKKCNKYTFK